MTGDMQAAMRRVVEEHAARTRFVLVTRNKERLIPAIRSRFAEVYVPPLPLPPAAGLTLPALPAVATASVADIAAWCERVHAAGYCARDFVEAALARVAETGGRQRAAEARVRLAQGLREIRHEKSALLFLVASLN
jgi:hypothetical protein